MKMPAVRYSSDSLLRVFILCTLKEGGQDSCGLAKNEAIYLGIYKCWGGGAGGCCGRWQSSPTALIG